MSVGLPGILVSKAVVLSSLLIMNVSKARVIVLNLCVALVSASCALENGTDFQGNDIRVGASKTVSDCCNECAQTPGCAAFTVWLGGPQCYLKSSAAGRRSISGHISGTNPNPLPGLEALKNRTDCLKRSLFVEYAVRVNPNVDSARARQIADALSGDPSMGVGCVINARPITQAAHSRRTVMVEEQDLAKVEFFADATLGNDSAAGTEVAPFQSVERAVKAVRDASTLGGGTVTLRSGVFHMNQTLELSDADSRLTLRTHAADDGLAWLSGAKPLRDVTWNPVNISGGANVWSANLSTITDVLGVEGLRLNGRRLWRARFPNGDPEVSFPFKAGLTAEEWINTPGQFPPRTQYKASLVRNDTLADKSYVMMSGGSACAKYEPPVSHYCGSSNDAGGGTVIAGKTLPNQPYKDAAGAVITAMHGGLWCSFTYRVGAYNWDNVTRMGHFNFSAGGGQCNRPEGGHGQLLIEGVLEELDEPGEFHFDTRTRILTLWHNATAGTPPPLDGSLEVLHLSNLVNVTGTQGAPVSGIQLLRVGMRDTAPAIFAPHVAPTGGDWAVNRAAAVTVSGTTGLTVRNVSFWRLDNAGIFIGGFNRNATIADSSFEWLGESAIVSVGDTAGMNASYVGFGADGTAGNQPRGTAVLRNLAREIGIVNKQSAMFFQAATDNTTLEGNIVFNGARSGINFNDAFGSGSRVDRNVLFNLNRETADHGCFNSWDRLPFNPSKDTQHRDVLSRNLLLSNFNSYNGIDTDDDSAYFSMKSNVLLYGHFLKSDFSGHDIEYDGDLGIFVGSSNQYQAVPTNHPNSVRNSVMISSNDGDNLWSFGGQQDCSNLTWPKLDNVSVYSPSACTTICGLALTEWQAQGKSVHNVSTAQLPHDAETILGWARDVLNI